MAMEKHHKKANKGAMEASHRSAKAAHAVGLGASESEHAPWGQGEMANMPQGVVMESYPKVRFASDNLDDTIKNIDHEVDHAESRRSKYVSNQH